MTATFVGIFNHDLISKINNLPGLGETIHGISLAHGMGGKASNACAQFAFLADKDHKPVLITSVGTDSNGTNAIQKFKEMGVVTDHFNITKDIPTGCAICFVLDKGESAIVIHPNPVTKTILEKSADVLMKSKYVVTNFEIPFEVALEALSIAKKGGATTILNVSPVPENPQPKMFKDCSIIIVNEHELKALGSVNSLFEVGVEAVIMTSGEKGATIHVKGKPEVNVPSPKVKPVDTTGAGDSFLGSFAYCLSKGKDYIESARIACITASISVTGIGAQGSYAKRDHPQLAGLIP